MTKFPGSFSVKILERVYDKKTMEDILEDYNGAKQRSGVLYDPSPLDIKVYKMWLKGELVPKQAAREMGIANYQTALARFAKIARLMALGEIK